MSTDVISQLAELCIGRLLDLFLNVRLLPTKQRAAQPEKKTEPPIYRTHRDEVIDEQPPYQKAVVVRKERRCEWQSLGPDASIGGPEEGQSRIAVGPRVCEAPAPCPALLLCVVGQVHKCREDQVYIPRVELERCDEFVDGVVLGEKGGVIVVGGGMGRGTVDVSVEEGEDAELWGREVDIDGRSLFQERARFCKNKIHACGGSNRRVRPCKEVVHTSTHTHTHISHSHTRNSVQFATATKMESAELSKSQSVRAFNSHAQKLYKEKDRRSC